MKNHNIPTWPPSFESAWINPEIKKFQTNNRDFEVGDSVCLWEHNPVRGYYTGRHINGIITHLKSLGDGIIIDISITHRENNPDYTVVNS